MIMDALSYLNGIFWGYLILTLLVISGVFYTVKCGFPQIRYFTSLFTNFKKEKSVSGGISGFAALCAALGGQVGTGSLVGVAAAIFSGGPGAVFWMWMTAVLGMVISFAEAVLGQLFRKSNGDGTFRGGPAYYMTYGMNNKFLAMVFSVCIIFGIGVVYLMVQGNSIAQAAESALGVDPLHTGILTAILVGAVIFGGVKRLADVASYLVPFMAAIYIGCTMYVLATNFSLIDDVFTLIMTEAFKFDSAAGGVGGYTIAVALRYGIARGLFSNDAGIGTAPSMHATALVKHPVNQGFSAMLGVFFTTIVVCSCTAFTIIVTGAVDTGETGIKLTQEAFKLGYGDNGKYIVLVSISLFCFTTLLADIYYGEVNLQWFSKNKNLITGYRVIALCLVVVSGIVSMDSLWTLVDFVLAIMVLVNVGALMYLSKYVFYALRNYDEQIKEGIETPVWDYTIDVTEADLKQPANRVTEVRLES
ncbi:sodium:alanine symporter [Vibrio sp. MACH09]|uniref:alanine/glycine:cation symporter family protein n=1 Tax=unclassified Vibrio TaxID=2614977 RepID=UPI001C10D9CE|nr:MULTISPECIES: sodium:alanine symporter family protein [unclassified Vibrio]GLO60556.1 sodium:alanine symporter [Vibrio sp. MACH09]